VHGVEGEGGRLGLRVEIFDMSGGACFGVEFIESILLSLQQHKQREKDKANDGEQSISVEVRRGEYLTPGLTSAEDRESACILVATQTL
jgi:hypothetical protein